MHRCCLRSVTYDYRETSAHYVDRDGLRPWPPGCTLESIVASLAGTGECTVDEGRWQQAICVPFGGHSRVLQLELTFTNRTVNNA